MLVSSNSEKQSRRINSPAAYLVLVPNTPKSQPLSTRKQVARHRSAQDVTRGAFVTATRSLPGVKTKDSEATDSQIAEGVCAAGISVANGSIVAWSRPSMVKRVLVPLSCVGCQQRVRPGRRLEALCDTV